jgi:hypothetical protein
MSDSDVARIHPSSVDIGPIWSMPAAARGPQLCLRCLLAAAAWGPWANAIDNTRATMHARPLYSFWELG